LGGYEISHQKLLSYFAKFLFYFAKFKAKFRIRENWKLKLQAGPRKKLSFCDNLH
jgi:hypothetical protein